MSDLVEIKVELAKLATIIQQCLGPDGSHTKAVSELKADFKEHVIVDAKVHNEVAELQRHQKARTKALWLAFSAVIVLAADAVWSRIFHKA